MDGRKPVCPVCGRPAKLRSRWQNDGGWPVERWERIWRLACPAGHCATDLYRSAEDAFQAWLRMCAWVREKPQDTACSGRAGRDRTQGRGPEWPVR